MTGNAFGMRADARRNRQRLLDTAVAALSEKGSHSSLEGIAKSAGVGIGTLYRHFPTREALVEAAYRNEVARVCDSATQLLEQLPPDRAMHAWMGRFIECLSTKNGMAEALRAVVATGTGSFSESLERINQAVGTLLEAGAAAGLLRPDVDPLDVGFSLSGILLVTTETGQFDRAGRMLDLLLDGLRCRPD